jgi:hypothetical protein
MEGSPNVPYHSARGTSRILQDLHLSKITHTEQKDCDSMLRTATSRAQPISVGIVGAGFAGLRCADILLQHGFKVTILEARNRLGGRVGQSWHLGHQVDLYVNDFGAGIGGGGDCLISRNGLLSSTANASSF